MSDSFRNGTVTAVAFGSIATVFAAVVWSLFVWNLSSQHAEYQQSAHQEASRAHERAKASIEATCITKPTPRAIAECVEELTKTAEEQRREAYDLAAQQEMSHWALGVLLVSVVTTIITGVGVWFVRETLVATQQTLRAANTANMIMRAESRPWLTVRRDVQGVLILSHINDSRNEYGYLCNSYLRWKYHPENVGKSPAFGVTAKQKNFLHKKFFSHRGRV